MTAIFRHRIAMRALAGVIFIVLALVGLSVAIPLYGRAADNDQGIIAGLISKVLSRPQSNVRIGQVEGVLSSDVTIRDIRIADRDGEWLRVDRVRLIWRRAALLARRLEIERLEIGTVEFLRKPLKPDGPVADDGPILPELPLKVVVKAFDLAELSLGAPVLGSAAQFSASGQVLLGKPAEGLDTRITLQRKDIASSAILAIKFVPKGDRLDLEAKYESAPGGLVAKLAGIPGSPAVRFDLKGAGTLDNWLGNLDFDAGPAIGARGEARIVRQGDARVLTLDATSQLEGLMPPIAAGIFAGVTSLKGDVAFSDDDTMRVNGFRLASQLAELTVSGAIDPKRQVDFSIQGRAIPGADTKTTVRGKTQIGRLVFNTTIAGAITAPVVRGRFDAADLATPEGRLASAQFAFSVDPQSPADPGSGGAFAIKAQGAVAGLSLADDGLSKALGGALNLDLAGVVDSSGIFYVARATAVTPTFSMGWQGKLGSEIVAGALQGQVTQLAAFSKLTGLRLAGALDTALQIDGEPSKRAWRLGIDAQARGLALGDARLDRLVGDGPSVRGRIAMTGDALTFSDFRASAQGFAATLSGTAGSGREGVKLNIELADLRRIDPQLRGSGQILGVLSGDLANPDGSLILRSDAMSAIGRPLRNILLQIEGKQLLVGMRATLSLSGSMDNRPLTAAAEIARESEGWRLSGLQFTAGAARLSGNLLASKGGLFTGGLDLDAPDLDHLSPLVLSPLRGVLNAKIALDGQAGKQNAGIQARARSVQVPGLSLSTLDADVKTYDLLGAPAAEGRVSIGALLAGGERIQKLVLQASRSGDATIVTANGDARGFAISANASIASGKETRIGLRTFSARRGALQIALAAPASIAVAKGGVEIRDLALRVGAGRIAISGTAGQRLALRLDARAVPLSAAAAFSPGLSLSGSADANARIDGAPDAPTGDWNLKLRGFSMAQLRSNGLRALTIVARGRLAGKRTSVDAKISGDSRLAMSVSGSAPLSPGDRLDLRLVGSADMALANATMASSGRSVAGKLNFDARIAGTARAPRVEGSAVLANGAFRDPLQGIALTKIAGRFAGAGDRVQIERLTANTANGGQISLSGTVRIDPAAGFPADLKIGARKAQLIANDVVDLVAGLDLSITGPVATAPLVSGRVDVVSLNVAIPDRLPGSSAPLRGARHIAPPPQTRARLDDIKRAKRAQARRKAGGGGPRIELRVNAPNQIFVRGRGVDAELGGSIVVSGQAMKPRASGAFELRRGSLTLLTQRLDFSRGKLTFNGDTIPELDFLASTVTGGVTAQVAVTGQADNPQFVISSSPAMPQDEVLSRLLFEKAAGSLTPFQTVQLAAAVAALAGHGGPDLASKARKALGVDTLDFNAGPSGPSVGASKYISRRVSIGATAGAKPDQNTVGLKIDLTRRLKLKAQTTQDGKSSVGIGAEIEY